MWVLGIEPQSSARAVSALNHSAISPAPLHILRDSNGSYKKWFGGFGLLLLLFCPETQCIEQAGLDLTKILLPLPLGAGIKGMGHHAQLRKCFWV